MQRHKFLFCITASALVWFALIVRLAFVISMADSWTAGVVKYLSFYTHLTNLLAALALTLPLFAKSSTGFFQRGSVIAGITVNLIVVSITFNVLLRHLLPLHGVQILADIVLHDLMPILFVLYWWFYAPKGVWRWRSMAYWLIYPIGFFCYSLVRGAVIGWYPYPFINVAQIGYGQTFINALGILAGLMAISALFMALDISHQRRLARQLVQEERQISQNEQPRSR